MSRRLGWKMVGVGIGCRDGGENKIEACSNHTVSLVLGFCLLLWLMSAAVVLTYFHDSSSSPPPRLSRGR